ncbi:MAG TPA: phosphatase PAP2 family protein [Chitinophagaceae bacterium]|nr:phosphatase PAP2 family protein [Chitinophagaceae bacterium]
MNNKTNQFWEIAALISAEMLLSLILFAAGMAVVVFLTRKKLRKYKYIDLAIFDRLQPLVNLQLNRIMLFFTFLGKHQFLIPANLFIVFYFLVISKHSWFSIRSAAIALSSLGLMFLLKYLFRRKRPLAPLLNAVKGLSFPSGHAIMAVTFYGFIIYILFHTVSPGGVRIFFTVLLVILILFIGFSRIYLRVHYASDVLSGFIIGLLWLSISLAVLYSIEHYFKEKGASSVIDKNKTAVTGPFLKCDRNEIPAIFSQYTSVVPGSI